MKRVFALAILLLLFLPFTNNDSTAGAGRLPESVRAPAPAEVHPAVSAALASSSTAEMHTVIVTLREQADLSQIPATGRARRQEQVIRALQARASSTQRGLRQYLALESAQGRAGRIHPFWVFNGLSITATAEVIEAVAARSEVASITPDEIDVRPLSVQAQVAPETNLEAIQAPDLWALGYQGQGIVVASVDSGVDPDHPDLVGRYRGGDNSWFDPYGEHPLAPLDLIGHGTATTGVMVGGDAGGTAIGVAPQAQWIAARIWNDAGASTATAIHQAFEWLLDPDGDPGTADAPHVVNNSWAMATPGCDQTFEFDLQALRAAGILPVFAAGNFGPSPESSASPANNPAAFAVGAVDDNGAIYGYSSRGPSACDGTVFPEVVAPGVGVHTTDLYGMYTDATGTSIAAPHASGGLALLLSAFPDLPSDVQEAALQNGAVDLGPAGADNDFGQGRIDLLASYQWLEANPVEATPTPTPTATPDPNVNLALVRPVSVSSFGDEAHGGAAAVDGDLMTAWQTERAKGKNRLPTEWLRVDLGASMSVSRVELTWDENYATAYRLLSSTDGNTWAPFFSTESGDGATDIIVFSAVSVRHIMLETTAWSNNSLRNWLQEFAVYAGGDPTATATPVPTATAAPTATATPTVTSAPGGTGTMHVGALTGVGSAENRGRWGATVTVSIHDANEAPVANATVDGSWSEGASGAGSCTTDSSGACSLTKSNLKSNVSSVTFAVEAVSHADTNYDPAANHDPVGDGTQVVVFQP